MGGKKTRSYTPQPAIDPEVAPRVQAVLKVLTKQWTMTEAASNLAISRNRFQTIYHRSLTAMLEELGHKPAGRPSRPEREKQLEQENARLRQQNARLSDRVGTIDRLLGVASDMLKGRITTSGRQARAKTISSSMSKSSTEGSSEPEDPDGAARRKLAAAIEMRELGLGPKLAAAVIGMSAQSVRRWAAAKRGGEPLCRRAGRRRSAPPDPTRVVLAGEVVRALHGMIGGDALRISTGLTRRQAVAVKAAVTTQMERERKQAAQRVVITAPGIVRGFDQLYAWTTAGWRFVLLSADASVPYRTSALVVEHYDEDAVLRAVAADIERNGAPLVWRWDRASCQRTRAVVHYLDEHGIAILHGPPRHAQYYGQLERQNREHRPWLRHLGIVAPDALQPACDRMVTALNTRWPRRALGWRTPADSWSCRRPIPTDLRARFREEVYDRTRKLEDDLGTDMAMRLAIEQALQQHGFLRIERRTGAN
jgi:hypothetical protein